MYVVTTTFQRLILNTRFTYFLTSIILDAKHEKIVRNKLGFFFRLHLKVSAYMLLLERFGK